MSVIIFTITKRSVKGYVFKKQQRVINIKQTASKFIVKHSTEWDDQVNMINLIKPIIDEYKKRVHDHEGVTKHLDNEKKRIQNLIFFNECKNNKIKGFPDSDKVFHFNPIGLVGEFKQCSKDIYTNPYKIKHIPSNKGQSLTLNI